LNFPYPARVTQAKPSEWARLPSAKECFLGGARKKFVQRSLLRFSNFFWEEPRPRRGDVVEAERRRAAGRRFWPRSVTPSRGRDTRRKAPQCTKSPLFLGAGGSPQPQLSHERQGLHAGTASSTPPCVLGSSRTPRGALSETSWAVQPIWQHDGTSK
jgi:hypothetical protein